MKLKLNWYLVAFLLGVAVALPYSAERINSALTHVGVLMLVALFASLLIAFAAFSRDEKHLKFVLMYAPLVAFGSYGVLVMRDFSIVNLVLMLSAMGMHLSYWMSGIHSRAFRLEQWKLGFAADMPQTARLIASLNGTGRSELGDAVVQACLQRQHLSEALLDELRRERWWSEAVAKEFERVFAG